MNRSDVLKEAAISAKNDFILRCFQSMAIASIVLSNWGFDASLKGTWKIVFWILWFSFFAIFVKLSIASYAIHKKAYGILEEQQQGTLPYFNWWWKADVPPLCYFFAISLFIFMVILKVTVHFIH